MIFIFYYIYHMGNIISKMCLCKPCCTVLEDQMSNKREVEIIYEKIRQKDLDICADMEI